MVEVFEYQGTISGNIESPVKNLPVVKVKYRHGWEK
jgi:hypothetical protein